MCYIKIYLICVCMSFVICIVNSQTENDDSITSTIPTPSENVTELNGLEKYELAPGVNITIDMKHEIVGVKLKEEYVKDLFEGRKKKDDQLLLRILPLFIIPFLIQSAIIPLLLSALKFMLIKSLLVGKLALFLVAVNAYKNSNSQSESELHHINYGHGDSNKRIGFDTPYYR